MIFFNKHTKTFFAVLIVGFSLMLNSCNNPAASGEEEHEHLFPVGVALFLNGEKIVEAHDGQVDGEITVQAGEETGLITVKFIAEDGDLFQPEGPENSLGFDDTDSSIAKIEQHDEDGKWRFHVVGISEGETEVILQLLHSGHSDFNSLPIPIIVTAN